MTKIIRPSAWGLESGEEGSLFIAGMDTVKLAHEIGTPLHIVNTGRLEETAAKLFIFSSR